MSSFIFEATRVERASIKHGNDFSMKVEEHSLGFFSSKENAEKAIAKCIKDFADAEGWTYGLAGFFVEKYCIDRTLQEKDTWASISEARWSYTKDGKPFSYSLFSSDWKEGEYSGTPEDAIKFKVGDYAWVYMCKTFVPAKILDTPFTPERWKEKFNFASDASDDCYLAMCPNGHDHPQTVHVFPMDETLPQKIVDAIDAAEKEYYGK